jgi:hypothetical protein
MASSSSSITRDRSLSRPKRPAEPVRELEARCAAAVKRRVRDVYAEVDCIPYKAGAQSATTTMYGIPYSTGGKGFDNMHSEMVALQDQLQRGRVNLGADGKVSSGGLPVPAAQFTTDMPHCGFCTFLLSILGLPLGRATKGKSNLGYLSYPVPLLIKQEPGVLVNILGFRLLKEMIGILTGRKVDDFVLTIPGEVDPALQRIQTPIVPVSSGFFWGLVMFCCCCWRRERNADADAVPLTAQNQIPRVDWADFRLTEDLARLWTFLLHQVEQVLRGVN